MVFTTSADTQSCRAQQSASLTSILHLTDSSSRRSFQSSIFFRSSYVRENSSSECVTIWWIASSAASHCTNAPMHRKKKVKNRTRARGHAYKHAGRISLLQPLHRKDKVSYRLLHIENESGRRERITTSAPRGDKNHISFVHNFETRQKDEKTAKGGGNSTK